MKKKILVVDDEKDFCFFLKENLELAGDFHVELCNDSSQVIQTTKNIRPDLILFDIMMPDKNGTEIAVELSNHTEIRNTPYIFLTAIISNNEANENNNFIGGHYFVGKPVKINELIGVINKVVPQ